MNALNLTHHVVCREYSGLPCTYLADTDSAFTIWKKDGESQFQIQNDSTYNFTQFVCAWSECEMGSPLSLLFHAYHVSHKHLLVLGVILMLKDAVQLFRLCPLTKPATSALSSVEEDHRRCKGCAAMHVSISSGALQLKLM